MNRIVLFIILLSVALALAVHAGVPQLINYQGVLTDASGNPLQGTYNVTFSIYGVVSGGTPLWSETVSISADGGGAFGVILGSTVPLEQAVFEGEERWLGTAIGGDAELVPRARLASLPYSFRVGTVDGAEGGTITGDLSVAGKASIGPGNTATGVCSFAAGSGHEVWGNYASVSGGRDNWATQGGTTVGGGLMNNAGDSCATVGGGEGNSSGEHGTVAGGRQNMAGGIASYVGGGAENTAEQNYSAIGGGYFNNAGLYGAIGGGEQNYTHQYGAIAGGKENVAVFYSAVTGGLFNQAGDGSYNSIIGGHGNIINECSWSTIGGGEGNEIYANRSAILGGYSNSIEASGNYSYLFGINSSLSEDSTFMVDMPHIRFGDEGTGYQFPAADGSSGQVMTTNGNGQLSWTTLTKLTSQYEEAIGDLKDQNRRLTAEVAELKAMVLKLIEQKP